MKMEEQTENGNKITQYRSVERKDISRGGEIDIHEFIKYLNDAKDSGAEFVKFYFDSYGDCNCEDNDIEISPIYYETETDEERDTRIKKEKQDRMSEEKAYKLKREYEEKREYERLKKKFNSI
jgi:hypothetical protein